MIFFVICKALSLMMHPLFSRRLTVWETALGVMPSIAARSLTEIPSCMQMHRSSLLSAGLHPKKEKGPAPCRSGAANSARKSHTFS